jgi:aldehyde dehydrogenase family 7 protein A1
LPLYDGSKLPVGDPLDPTTLIGPLHNPGAREIYMKTLNGIKSRGGKVLTKREGPIEEVQGFAEGKGGNFVWPIVIQPKKDDPSWREEYVSAMLRLAPGLNEVGHLRRYCKSPSSIRSKRRLGASLSV